MSDQALLNDYLNALEAGETPEAIITRTPADDGDLAELVQLAADIRAMEHPSMAPEIALAQQKRVMAATATAPLVTPKPSTNGKAATIPAATLPVPSLNGSRPHPSRRFRPALVGGFGLAVALVLLLSGIVLSAFWWSTNRQVRSVTLEDASGVVEVAQDGVWETAITGDRVLVGQRVRTGPDSDVTLVFFEGSQTRLGPNSDVTLSTVGGTAGGTLRVRLTQWSGLTSNDVVPLKGADGYFIVDTPSGRAVVQGTQFDVTVGDEGQAVFLVNRGQVRVSSAGEEVVLRPGQATASATGESLEDPAYTFSLEGELSGISGNTWTIAGQDVVVRKKTTVSGDPVVGDTVLANGRVSDEGLWLADSVQKVDDEAEAETTTGSFTGTVDSMGDETWSIGGYELSVAGADIDPGLVEGDLVYVTFEVVGDDWQALTIQKVDDDEDDEDDSDLDDTDEVTDLDEDDPDDETVPVADCLANPNPHAEQLAAEFANEYEALDPATEETEDTILDQIMSMHCEDRYGFGEIEHAYKMFFVTSDETFEGTAYTLEQIMEMRASGMGWGQIKQELELQTPNGKLPKEKSNNGKGPNSDTSDADTPGDTTDDTPTDVPDAPADSSTEKGSRSNRGNAYGHQQNNNSGQSNKPETSPSGGSGNTPPGQDKAKDKGKNKG